MNGMSSLMPILVIVFALVAAGLIAFIAWKLSSDDFYISRGDDREDDSRS